MIALSLIWVIERHSCEFAVAVEDSIEPFEPGEEPERLRSHESQERSIDRRGHFSNILAPH